MTDYDRDPEALKWARTKVQEVVDKAEACATNTQLSDETREGWRQTALFIRHELVRRDGAAYASFDERWPSLANAAPAATEATDEDYCGAEPPPNGNWGDCWCTLPPGHPDGHRCQPCTERHSAPDWTDPPTPCPACRRADQAGLAPAEQHNGCVNQETR
jgi:hypothetical protein